MKRTLRFVGVLLAVATAPATASAVITVPAAGRLSAPVTSPAYRAACAHYYDLNRNTDLMGNDNHTSLGHTYLVNYALMPPMGGVRAEAQRAITTIDLTHHRGACYSPGETPGGYVWATDPTGSLSGVVTLRGYLNVTGAAGSPVTWTFALAANDSTRVRIGGVQVLEEYWADSTRWKKFVQVTFPQPGVYALELDNVTNHNCDIDPVELYYAPSAIAGLDGVCACGAGCAFDAAGCTAATVSIVNRSAALRLIDASVLMARADGSVPPASDNCAQLAQVVDPGSPGTFIGCVSDADCAGDTPVCGAMNTCVSGCGNARLDRGEACDDGNTTSGDGCSATCAIEAGYSCTAPANVLSNSSFAMNAAGWNAGGITVETNAETTYGGRDPSNIVAEVDNGSAGEGNVPRALSQSVMLVNGRRYALGLRYVRRVNAPATMRINVTAPGTNLGTLALSSTGPFVYRSALRTITATAATGSVTINHDPSSYTGPSGLGMIVDDVELWAAGTCAQLDSDGDGIPDLVEVTLGTNPMNPDTDGDGVRDGAEVGPGPTFMGIDTDGDGIINARDADDDGDGINTADELGPGGAASPRNSDAMVPAGQGTSDTIPDYLDSDDDGDSIPTAVERMLGGMAPDPDGDMLPAWLDRDSDGDTVFDIIEAGATPTMPVDTDSDTRRDFLDTDSDNDCVLDSDPREAGAARTSATMPSMNANSNCAAPTPVCNVTAGLCVADMDDDMDGIPNLDEVRIGSNPMNADTDGDGVRDGLEVGAGPAFMPRDTDMDGMPDFNDTDDDGDGVLTRDELGAGGASMPQNSDATVPMGSGTSDMIPDYLDPDDDGDSIPTAVERMLEGMTAGDTDMVPAYLDLDSDGDSVPDFVEVGSMPTMPANSDGMAGAGDRPDFLDTDSDNDCVGDSDPREAGAARVDPAMPSASADSNCAGGTCDRSTGMCIGATDAGVDASDASAGDASASDAGMDSGATDASVTDSGRSDASTSETSTGDAGTSDASTGLLSGDGACACRAPAARGSRGTSATMALLAMSALAIARRVRRKR